MHRLQVKRMVDGIEVMLDGKVLREVVRLTFDTQQPGDPVVATITLFVDPNIDVLADVTLDEVFPTKG